MFGELEKIISFSENKWILKGLKDTDSCINSHRRMQALSTTEFTSSELYISVEITEKTLQLFQLLNLNNAIGKTGLTYFVSRLY